MVNLPTKSLKKEKKEEFGLVSLYEKLLILPLPLV